MSLEGNLRTRLANDPAIAAVVGAKVYVENAPQGTAEPYLTLGVISTINYHEFTQSAGRSRARVQIDAWCAAPSERQAVTEALKSNLIAFRGELIAGGVFALGVGFTGPANSFIRPQDGGESGVYRGLCEARIIYTST